MPSKSASSTAGEMLFNCLQRRRTDSVQSRLQFIISEEKRMKMKKKKKKKKENEKEKRRLNRFKRDGLVYTLSSSKHTQTRA